MSTTGVQSETHRALTALAAMPRQIVRIARGCNDLQLHRNPAPGAWSARDILAHLRACAEVWGRSIDRMITEDQPTIRYISPRGWIKRTNYLEQSFRDSLRAFSGNTRGLRRSTEFPRAGRLVSWRHLQWSADGGGRDSAGLRQTHSRSRSGTPRPDTSDSRSVTLLLFTLAAG
ncbi:MAG: DinB family protein [Gemmatimonadetes bacterium]|nr:DinB family protein [Gemmatimonadota bacterium]